MHIKEKIISLIDQKQIEEACHFIETTDATATLWGARAIEHKDYSGAAPLYWLIESFTKIKTSSFDDIDSWECLKRALYNYYLMTTIYLRDRADIVVRILNYLREFKFSEWRPQNPKDFKTFVSDSLDTRKYQVKKEVHTMYDDFWESYHHRRKMNLNRKAARLQHRASKNAH